VRRKDDINSRLIQVQVPQTLPVSQLEPELLLNEKVLPPESLEAKVEIFLVTF
jgi:hypothetical protein